MPKIALPADEQQALATFLAAVNAGTVNAEGHLIAKASAATRVAAQQHSPIAKD
ncbi:hypothetical protein GALL_522400 [mine drainage metagenome]|uniref:Uncharacterized protein n=1 Tax=mine drainage metagenome TaxID=410659 RepID=A0A1J5PLM5_9ZZZZ